jgi:hypothetical protein
MATNTCAFAGVPVSDLENRLASHDESFTAYFTTPIISANPLKRIRRIRPPSPTHYAQNLDKPLLIYTNTTITMCMWKRYNEDNTLKKHMAKSSNTKSFRMPPAVTVSIGSSVRKPLISFHGTQISGTLPETAASVRIAKGDAPAQLRF